jgi:hypothetical protein
MVGTGKSTVAYTLSDILDRNLILGASFCSCSEEDCRNVDNVLRTLTYGLAQRFPSVSHALVDVLQSDPDVGYKFMRRRFSYRRAYHNRYRRSRGETYRCDHPRFG